MRNASQLIGELLRGEEILEDVVRLQGSLHVGLAVLSGRAAS
jgi:hypothetical protein